MAARKGPARTDPAVHPEAAVAPGYLANHAARAFNRRVDDDLRPHGMSLALIGPLLLLSWKGPMLQRDMVKASAVRQPALTALLSKLEGLGLIVREAMSSDRRASMVSLTDPGRRMAELGGQALIAANRRGLAGFPLEEERELVRLLKKLTDNLGADGGTKHQD